MMHKKGMVGDDIVSMVLWIISIAVIVGAVILLVRKVMGG